MVRSPDYLLLAVAIILFRGTEGQHLNLKNLDATGSRQTPNHAKQEQANTEAIKAYTSTEKMKCQIPGEKTLYIPRNRVYCIYGIGFTAEKYEEEVLYNNNASPYIDQLEAATIPACKSNLLMEAEYGGGWIQTSNGMLNVFFVCCKKCDEFNTSAKRIRLRLKNMFTAYSYLNFKKIYEVFKSNDKMKELLYAGRYLLVIDDKEASSRVIDLSTCLSDGFHLSASLVYTPVCWIKTSWRRQCEICGDPPGIDFLNIRVEKGSRLLRTLGAYDAFGSRKVEELRCSNSDPVNKCHYWNNFTTYSVECCCYGNDTERIRCQCKLSDWRCMNCTLHIT